jgi:asparagine synthase (glutamine-hydrolysing)
MCGITGIVAKHALENQHNIDTLINSIRHRGPDDRGDYLSPKRKCAIGHTRLAILDLSAAGHQPMVDEATGNAIVFNGEIYNFADLRKICEADGYRFYSHSDTEVILALYRIHDVNCLRFLRGMFAFAIWDEKRQRLFFARDRVGKKPFHYALSAEGFAFCSEIDPLARHPWTDRGLDVEALDFYLQMQYIPAPLTIYKGIRKLLPGHYGILDDAGLQIVPYWRVDYRDKLKIEEDEAIDAFEEKFREAVKLRMVADVPVGALLSGGVDSSVVVALMARFATSPVHTFSIGFAEAEFDESAYAQQAAEICGTLHRPATMYAPDHSAFPNLVQRYGEPFADSSSLPSFAVCALARQDVKVVLNGDGGDELLGGYPRYSLSDSEIYLATWLRKIRSLPMRGSVSWLSKRGHFPFKKIRRLFQDHFLLPDARPLTMYGSHWTDEIRSDLMGEYSLLDNLPQWRENLFYLAREASANPVDTMLWLDNHTYLHGDLLVKMDIAAMHCGLEARSPLLDHELIEFCARLPLSMKVKRKTGKYLLKKLAERYFPHDFVYRRKMGFGIPLAKWLRGPLRGLLNDVLRDPESMRPLNLVTIEKHLKIFLDQGDDREATRIWTLLMFGLWQRNGVTPVL